MVAACLAPIWLCLVEYFHPQDLIAMGLALGAMACARRDSWVAAGLLVTCAFLSQQFAVLVAVPLLVLAPSRRRPAYVGGGMLHRRLRDRDPCRVELVESSGPGVVRHREHGGKGTALSTLHLHGALLVFSSRGVPIALSFLLAWWVLGRLGTKSALQPVVVVSVVALSLGFRLVFEQALFGYYFMALVVMLVLLDVVTGRIRESLVVWLTMVTLVFLVGPTTSHAVLHRSSWGHGVQMALTPIVVALVVLVVSLRFVYRGFGRDLLVWVGLLVGAVLVWPSTIDPVSGHLPSVLAGRARVLWPVLGGTTAAQPGAPWNRAGTEPKEDLVPTQASD